MWTRDEALKSQRLKTDLTMAIIDDAITAITENLPVLEKVNGDLSSVAVL